MSKFWPDYMKKTLLSRKYLNLRIVIKILLEIKKVLNKTYLPAKENTKVNM